MSEKDRIKKELSQLSPFLSKSFDQKTESVNNESDDFFEKMQFEILQETVGKKEIPTLKVVHRNKSWFRYVVGIAAISILFLFGYNLLFNQTELFENNTEITTSIEALPEDLILDYLEEDFESLNINQISDILSEISYEVDIESLEDMELDLYLQEGYLDELL